MLVRWGGFNNSQQTWEPLESFVTGSTFNSELESYEQQRVGDVSLAHGTTTQPSYLPLTSVRHKTTKFKASDGWVVALPMKNGERVQRFLDRHGLTKKEFELYNLEAFGRPFKTTSQLPGKRAFRIAPPAQDHPAQN